MTGPDLAVQTIGVYRTFTNFLTKFDRFIRQFGYSILLEPVQLRRKFPILKL